MTNTPPAAGPLARGEVRIVCRITEALDERAQLDLVGVLSSDERARHERFRFARDRRDYAAAHALLRTTLSWCTGDAPATWRFETTNSGKPFLPPGFPKLSFNLSHAHGIVACAVTENSEVGIDVETIDRPADVERIAERFFAASERAALRALMEEGARRARFFELWTLKEAFLKAIGSGLGHPLDALSFDLDREHAIVFAPPPDTRADAWQFALFVPTARHRLAIAVRQGGGRSIRAARLLDGEDTTALQPIRVSNGQQSTRRNV